MVQIHENGYLVCIKVEQLNLQTRAIWLWQETKMSSMLSGLTFKLIVIISHSLQLPVYLLYYLKKQQKLLHKLDGQIADG